MKMIVMAGIFSCLCIASAVQGAAEPIKKSELNEKQKAGAQEIAKAIVRRDAEQMFWLFNYYFTEGIILYNDANLALQLTRNLDAAVKKFLSYVSQNITNNEAYNSFNDIINENKKIIEAQLVPSKSSKPTKLGKFEDLNPDLIRQIAQSLSVSDIVKWIKASPMLSPILQPVLEERNKLVKLWSKKPNELVLKKWANNQITATVFSPDGLLLATGASYEDTIKLLGVAEGRKIREFTDLAAAGRTGGATSLAFSADGSILAAGFFDYFVRWWDVKTAVLKGKAALNGRIFGIHFMSKDILLVVCTQEETVYVWRINLSSQQPELIAQFQDFGDILGAALSPNGKIVVDRRKPFNTQKLYDIETKEKREPEYKTDVYQVFSHDNTKFVSAYKEDITLWNAQTGKEIKEFKAAEHAIPLAFSPDDMILAFYDGNLMKLLNVETGAIINSWLQKNFSINTATSFSPDGKTFVAGDGLGNLVLWSAKP